MFVLGVIIPALNVIDMKRRMMRNLMRNSMGNGDFALLMDWGLIEKIPGDAYNYRPTEAGRKILKTLETENEKAYNYRPTEAGRKILMTPETENEKAYLENH